MSATSLDWAPSGTDKDSSGMSGTFRLVLAVFAIGCAAALLASDQSAIALTIADWLGLDAVSEGAKDFVAALTR